MKYNIQVTRKKTIKYKTYINILRFLLQACKKNSRFIIPKFTFLSLSLKPIYQVQSDYERLKSLYTKYIYKLYLA